MEETQLNPAYEDEAWDEASPKAGEEGQNGVAQLKLCYTVKISWKYIIPRAMA